MFFPLFLTPGLDSFGHHRPLEGLKVVEHGSTLSQTPDTLDSPIFEVVQGISKAMAPSVDTPPQKRNLQGIIRGWR